MEKKCINLNISRTARAFLMKWKTFFKGLSFDEKKTWWKRVDTSFKHGAGSNCQENFLTNPSIGWKSNCPETRYRILESCREEEKKKIWRKLANAKGFVFLANAKRIYCLQNFLPCIWVHQVGNLRKWKTDVLNVELKHWFLPFSLII